MILVAVTEDNDYNEYWIDEDQIEVVKVFLTVMNNPAPESEIRNCIRCERGEHGNIEDGRCTCCYARIDSTDSN